MCALILAGSYPENVSFDEKQKTTFLNEKKDGTFTFFSKLDLWLFLVFNISSKMMHLYTRKYILQSRYVYQVYF